MAEDISRNTIFVLIILTLLVSVLGMWTVLSQVPGGEVTLPAQGDRTSTGTVQLRIEPPPAPVTDLATGQVSLTILDS